jgi:hypothetical protein
MNNAMWQWSYSFSQVSKEPIRRSDRPHCIPPSFELLRVVDDVDHAKTHLRAAAFARLQVFMAYIIRSPKYGQIKWYFHIIL